ncbi:MAG: hypothetical protein EKK55_08465, partial [Rhodocyclaceae bacterium]
ADQIACFLDEDEMLSAKGWRIGARQLYQRYVEWAKINGHRQLSNRIFGERLKTATGVGHRKTRDGHEYFDAATVKTA